MNGKYIIAVLYALLASVSLCVLVMTDFNALAALIYILPMVAETLEATATKKDAMFERIIDVVCLIGSCGCLVLIVSYMLGDNTISEQMIKYLLLMYPFYKNFQAVGAYSLKKEERI